MARQRWVDASLQPPKTTRRPPWDNSFALPQKYEKPPRLFYNKPTEEELLLKRLRIPTSQWTVTHEIYTQPFLARKSRQSNSYKASLSKKSSPTNVPGEKDKCVTQKKPRRASARLTSYDDSPYAQRLSPGKVMNTKVVAEYPARQECSVIYENKNSKSKPRQKMRRGTNFSIRDFEYERPIKKKGSSLQARIRFSDTRDSVIGVYGNSKDEVPTMQSSSMLQTRSVSDKIPTKDSEVGVYRNYEDERPSMQSSSMLQARSLLDQTTDSVLLYRKDSAYPGNYGDERSIAKQSSSMLQARSKLDQTTDSVLLYRKDSAYPGVNEDETPIATQSSLLQATRGLDNTEMHRPKLQRENTYTIDCSSVNTPREAKVTKKDRGAKCPGPAKGVLNQGHNARGNRARGKRAKGEEPAMYAHLVGGRESNLVRFSNLCHCDASGAAEKQVPPGSSSVHRLQQRLAEIGKELGNLVGI